MERQSWFLIGGFALLIAAVAALAVLAPRGADDGSDAGDVVVINMTASRYEFSPGSSEPLVVDEGDKVIIRLTSLDVTHGFAITEYGINREIAAGEVVEIEFRATKPGSFLMYCTVFCGVGHPQHKGTLHVA